MSRVTLQVEVEKEIFDVIKTLADLILAIKADPSNVLTVAAAHLPAVISAVGEVSKIGDNIKDDAGESIKAAMLPLVDAVQALIKG